MNTVLRTEVFDAWLSKLKNVKGKARIIERIRSAERGHFGDSKALGEGVAEMRVHYGPGYRVYFTRVGNVVFVLLCGGTKDKQKRDIARAQTMARELKKE